MAEYVDGYLSFWWTNIETEDELVEYLDNQFLDEYDISQKERRYVEYSFSAVPVSVQEHLKGIFNSLSFFNEVSDEAEKKKIPLVTAIVNGLGMKIDEKLHENANSKLQYIGFFPFDLNAPSVNDVTKSKYCELRGQVSAWLVNSESQEALVEYVDVENTSKDKKKSLCKAYGIKWYDHDGCEALKFDEITRENMLQASYADSFIDGLIEDIAKLDFDEANSLVLLYDFQYNKVPKNQPANARFVGHYKYSTK